MITAPVPAPPLLCHLNCAKRPLLLSMDQLIAVLYSMSRNKNIRNLIVGLWFFSILFSTVTADADADALMGGNEKTTRSGYGIEELSISHRQSFCEQNDAMLKGPINQSISNKP